MKPPPLGPKDLLYYGAFIVGTIVGFFLLSQFGVGGVIRTLGAMALGWTLGFVVDRIAKREG